MYRSFKVNWNNVTLLSLLYIEGKISKEESKAGGEDGVEAYESVMKNTLDENEGLCLVMIQ